MKRKIHNFFSYKMDGLGVVEIVLIILVLISLVIIFRDQIQKLIEGIIEKITNNLPDP